MFSEADDFMIERDNSHQDFVIYNRLNHFREILRQTCGISSNSVPDAIIKKVRCHLDEQNLKYDIENIKTFLVHQKLVTYYENVQAISNILNMRTPLQIGSEVQKFLEDHFVNVCDCYREVAFPRSSFLNYRFVFRKLLQLAKQQYIDDAIIDELLEATPLHLSRSKHEHAMNIWKNICVRLDWHVNDDA